MLICLRNNFIQMQRAENDRDEKILEKLKKVKKEGLG